MQTGIVRKAESPNQTIMWTLSIGLIRNGMFNFSWNTIIASCWMWLSRLSQLFLLKRQSLFHDYHYTFCISNNRDYFLYKIDHNNLGVFTKCISQNNVRYRFMNMQSWAPALFSCFLAFALTSAKLKKRWSMRKKAWKKQKCRAWKQKSANSHFFVLRGGGHL